MFGTHYEAYMTDISSLLLLGQYLLIPHHRRSVRRKILAPPDISLLRRGLEHRDVLPGRHKPHVAEPGQAVPCYQMQDAVPAGIADQPLYEYEGSTRWRRTFRQKLGAKTG